MVKYLEDQALESISGGAGSGVVTYYGGAPIENNYTTAGLVQNLPNNVNEKALGVQSNTGDGNGNFILNAWDPKADTFRDKGLAAGQGNKPVQS